MGQNIHLGVFLGYGTRVGIDELLYGFKWTARQETPKYVYIDGTHCLDSGWVFTTCIDKRAGTSYEGYEASFRIKCLFV